MPTYQISAPNGKTYRIDGPEGATDEQIRAEVLRQHPDAGSAPAKARAARPAPQKPKPYSNPKGRLPERLLTGGGNVGDPILRRPWEPVAKPPPAPKARPTVAAAIHRPAPKPKPAAVPGANVIFGNENVAPTSLADSLWEAEDAMRQKGVDLVAGYLDPAEVARRQEWEQALIPAGGLLDRMRLKAKQSALRVGSGGARVLAAGMNAIDEGFGDPLTNRANQVDSYVRRKVEGETTLDDLRTNFSLSGLGNFVAEQGSGSAADMALLSTGAGVAPYFVSQSGNIGQQRARNNDTGTATLSDIVKAAPAAGVSTAAERLGTKYLGGEMGGNLAVRLGGSAVSEFGTEAVQSFAEYTGGTAGTDAGFKADDAWRATRDGAITGGLVGPGIRLTVAEAPAAAQSLVNSAIEARAAQAEREAFSPLATAIAVDAFKPSQTAPAAAPDPVLAPRKVTPAPAAPKGPVEAATAPIAEPAVEPVVTTEEAKPPVEQPEASPTKPFDLDEALRAAREGAPAAEPKPVAKPPIAAREETRRVTIPTGGKIDVRMELVSADDITQAEGSKQNRDRDRAASEAQIMGIVGKFDPEQLGDDNYTDRGAPIVGPDGTIESGNGRVLAINRIFDERPELAQAYRDYIESQGFDTKGVERPVLIRRRVTEMDDAALRQFITGSNSDTKQELSAPERAAQDASDILTPDTMAKYMGGSLASQRNGDFIRKFIEAVPDGQRSTFMDEKGNLSTAGIARIENAMLARAFGNGTPAAKRFLSKAMENTDNQTRTLTGALSEVAADWGKMTAAMAEGTVDKRYDLTDQVLEAIGMVADAKGDGQTVANILKSDDMYDKLDPVVRRLIEAFHNPAGTRLKSKQKIAEMLENYARIAMEQRPEPDMFGEVVMREPVDVMNEAFGEVDNDMFAVAAEDRAPAKQGALADAGGGKAPRARPAIVDMDDTSEPEETRPYAGDASVEDAGPYDPSMDTVAFTDRASIYTGAAHAVGVDPAKFRLLPTERQIFLLSKLIKERFGVQVTVDRQLQDRFAIDQMLDMIQNVQGMAHVLGLAGPGISLGGALRLSLAKKARYLGAYYPAQRRIDLPQRSNSFAHEWGHAFDFYMLDMFEGAAGVGLSGALRQDGRAIAEAGMGPQGVRAAYADLLNALFFDRAAMAHKIMQLEMKVLAAKTDKQKAVLQAQIDNYRAGGAATQDNRSDYYRKAKAMGGDYWQKPTEMFARAFEAYVSFRVELLGLTTEMIGKGDAAYLSDADDRLAKTFPKGTERNEIFRAFDELFMRVNEQTALGRGPVMPAPDTGDTDPVSNLDKLAVAAPTSLVARQIKAFRDAALQEQKKKAGRGSNPKGKVKRFEDGVSAIFYALASRIRMISRHWKAPTVMSLHDLLTHAEGRGRFVGRTLLEATSIRRNRSLNRLDNILVRHGLDGVLTAEQDRMLRDLLITQDPADAPENFVAAASAIRQLLDQEFYENQNVGMDIGYVKNGYLPRIFDMPKIDFDTGKFTEQAAKVYDIVFDNEFGTDPAFMLTDEESLSKFRDVVRSLAKERPIAAAKPFFKAYNELKALYRAMEKAQEPDAFAEPIGKKVEEVTELLGELMAETKPIFSEVKAERWLAGIQTSDMNDFDAHAPNADYAKKRELPPEADKLLEDFYIANPVQAVTTYLTQSARRTEYARVFGPKGEKRKALFQKIAAEGVSREDQTALSDMVDIMTGRQKSHIPGAFARGASGMHGLATMVMLPRAVWASVMEPITAGMRTQDVRQSFRAMSSVIAGALGTANAKHRVELARALGIIEAPGLDEMVANRFEGGFDDGGKISEGVSKMFKWTGLAALTRAQRTHLLACAQAYFDNLAGHVVGSNAKMKAHATALLNELGVRDVEAFSKQIRETRRLPQVDELDTPFGRDYGTAANRFINQIIQNPTAADRPQMANNPVGRVIYAITSFVFSWWRNVAKREGILFNETRKRTGAAHASLNLVAGFLPSLFMLYIGQTIVSAIREFLTNHDRWEEDDEKDVLLDRLLKTGFFRTVSFGAADPFINAWTGLKYQRDLANTFVGASLGYFLQQFQAISRLGISNSPKNNTTEHNAFNGFYNLIVAPAATYALSRAPGGPLLGPLLGGTMMTISSPQAGKTAATAVVGEKGSQTDPETGEITGPPKKKKGEAAPSKYGF